MDVLFQTSSTTIGRMIKIENLLFDLCEINAKFEENKKLSMANIDIILNFSYEIDTFCKKYSDINFVCPNAAISSLHTMNSLMDQVISFVEPSVLKK